MCAPCIMSKLMSLWKGNPVARNGIIFTFFAFLNQGINFLLLLVLTSFLVPEMYGKLNLFNTYLLFINIFVMLNANGLVGVNYFKVSREHTQKTIYSIILTGCFFTIFSILVLCFFPDFWQQISGFSAVYLGLAVIYCFFNNISSLNLVLWRAEQKPIQYGFYSAGLVFLNAILTIVFIVFCKLEWEARIYAQFSVSCVFVTLSIVFLLKRKYVIPQEIPHIRYFLEIMKFGVPLIPNAISWWATQGVNRILINRFFDLASVGYFSFASNVCNLIQVVGSSFYQSYQVDIYKQLNKQKEEAVPYLRRLTLKITTLYIVISLIFFVCSYLLVPYVFPKYTDALPMFIPLCLGAFFSNMQQLFISYLFYFGRTKEIMWINVSCTIIGIALGYILIRYNILIAAYLLCFTHACVFILTFGYSQKLYSLEFYTKRSSLH